MSEQLVDTQPMFKLPSAATEENGDNRAVSRTEVDLPVLVVADNTAFGIRELGIEGRITDMTLVGARLVTGEELRKDRIWVRLGDKRDLLECEVSWMKLLPDGFAYGIRFLSMPAIEDFKQLIEGSPQED